MPRPSWCVRPRRRHGLRGVQVTTSPIVLVARLRAWHSVIGTGITSGTLPPVTSTGIVDSKLKRRASIQRVPCSHSKE